jgi:signal transduction histidine kinase
MAGPAQEQLTLVLSIGTIGILLLAVFIVLIFFVYQKRMLMLHQQKRDLEGKHQEEMIALQLESQENERKRIAKDLHDSVGSLLWGAKVNASYIGRTVDFESDVQESFKELVEILDQSIHTVRRIAWELTPEVFLHAGLSLSLSKLCEQLDGKGMKVTFIETGSILAWNDNDALQVYRIVQELASNSIKHSDASSLAVSLMWEHMSLLIEVEDDGKGFQLNGEQTGVGWWNIKQRARQLKADIKIGLSPMGSGALVSMTIPLNHEILIRKADPKE